MAQWFDLCSMMEPFFIEMADVVKMIAPASCMWEMHAFLHQVHDITRSQRLPCFKIRDGIPANMVVMLAQWQHNPKSLLPSDKRMIVPSIYPMLMSGCG